MTWHHSGGPSIIGHAKLFIRLTNAYKANRLHNSLIFSGPKGVGKCKTAMHLAHFLLANGNDNIDITNKMQNGSHPDFKLLTPEDDSDIISVDQVRKINDFLRFTNIESKNKVIVIDSLDSMNNNAANALLKILEEPPENCFFICIVHSIGKILPTIRSRCRIENFHKITKTDFQSHFERFSFQGNIDDLHTTSSGSIGAANLLIENDFAELISLIREIIGGKRTYLNVKKLAEAFSNNNVKWEICYKLLWLELHEKFKNEALNNSYDPNKIDRIEDLMAFIYNAKKSHLDVQQTILGALS